MAVALLALFVALGGTGYAALSLPKNSVGSKQLRRSSVTSDKVKDRSLLAKDFRKGQLPAGPRGLAGPPGVKGDRGDTGPSDAFTTAAPAPVTVSASDGTPDGTPILSLALPAGNYVVVATGTLVNFDVGGVADNLTCKVAGGGGSTTFSGSGGPVSGGSSTGATADYLDGMSGQLVTTLAAPGTVSWTCQRHFHSLFVSQPVLTAIRVGSITHQ